MAIGYEARLHRRGVGRYVNAAFLGLWLCGWLLGECFALGALIWGSFALLTGHPLSSGAEPLDLAAAVAMGAFLLVWLSFWTIGGVVAISELLRELWGEDRVAVAPDSLVTEWRAGPFRRSRWIPRAEILDLVRLPQKGVLAVETARERIEICRLGSDEERREVADALRRELGLERRAEVRPA